MDNVDKQLTLQTNYLRAITALLVQSYDGTAKAELLLAESGLDYQEIAKVLNKKPDAVRMLLKRAKQAKS